LPAHQLHLDRGIEQPRQCLGSRSREAGVAVGTPCTSTSSGGSSTGTVGSTAMSLEANVPGRASTGIRPIQFTSRRDQYLYRVDMLSFAGQDETRRVGLGRSGIHIRTSVLDQILAHRGMPSLTGEHQGRHTLTIFAIDQGTGLYQILDDFPMSFLGGAHQRSRIQ
jgi:hypothetical protein